MPRKYNQGSIELDLKKVEAGVLGKFFGLGDNIPRNVGGFIALILVITIVYVLIFLDESDAINIISLLSPILIGVVGFLFGRISS